MTGRRFAVVALAALVVAEGAVLGWLLLRSHWQASAAASPVLRGQRVAERMGCFGCHGPGGVAGSKNPGAKGGEVPALDALLKPEEDRPRFVFTVASLLCVPARPPRHASRSPAAPPP